MGKAPTEFGGGDGEGIIKRIACHPAHGEAAEHIESHVGPKFGSKFLIEEDLGTAAPIGTQPILAPPVIAVVPQLRSVR